MSGATSMTGHQRPVRGTTNVWLTPPHIIEALAPFDLDPCAAVDQPWRTATRHLTESDDGLAHEWAGLVWCNPPFGPEVGEWLNRLAEHGNGIGLCAARTETRWFVSAVWGRADAVLFLHGRPHFHTPDGERGYANSGVPICLIGYGPTAVQRLRDSGLDGTLLARKGEAWSTLGGAA